MLCSTGFLKNPVLTNLGLAVALVAAPASQAYVERIFLVCGDFTAERETRPKRVWRRVFLKINSAILAKLPKGTLAK